MINNPYYDEFLATSKDSPLSLLKISPEARYHLCTKYSFAVPDQEALNKIKEFTGDLKLVEVGAGTGYWLYLLDQMGINCEGYDKNIGKSYIDAYQSDFQQWFDVKEGDESVLSDMAEEHVLFLSWVPYGSKMGSQCLKSFKYDRVIIIGEGFGGCTGDDTMFDVLSEKYKEVEEFYIPRHLGIYDTMIFYERKKEEDMEDPS